VLRLGKEQVAKEKADCTSCAAVFGHASKSQVWMLSDQFEKSSD